MYCISILPLLARKFIELVYSPSKLILTQYFSHFSQWSSLSTTSSICICVKLIFKAFTNWNVWTQSSKRQCNEFTEEKNAVVQIMFQQLWTFVKGRGGLCTHLHIVLNNFNNPVKSNLKSNIQIKNIDAQLTLILYRLVNIFYFVQHMFIKADCSMLEKMP